MSKKFKPRQKGQVEDPKFLAFVNRQDSERTKKTYMGYSKVILGFAQCSGQAMLDDKATWEETKLFTFKAWLEKQGYSPYYIESILGCTRGFFRVFKRPLTIDRQDARKLAKRHRLEEDYYFKKEDMAKLYNCATATEREKYVIFVGVSLGLRAEDFSKITYGQLRQAMKDEQEPKSMGKINTEKQEIPAYPFLSHDAVEVVKAVLANHPEAKNEDRAYDGVPEKLSAIVRNIAQKSDLDIGNKRLVFHCLRKVLYNALNTKMGDKAKYVVGKAIEEKAYLDQDVTELREGYREAESIFSANGTKNGTSPETKSKLFNLEKENRELREKLKLLEGTSTTHDTENKQRIDELYTMIKELQEKK